MHVCCVCQTLLTSCASDSERIHLADVVDGGHAGSLGAERVVSLLQMRAVLLKAVAELDVGRTLPVQAVVERIHPLLAHSNGLRLVTCRTLVTWRPAAMDAFCDVITGQRQALETHAVLDEQRRQFVPLVFLEMDRIQPALLLEGRGVFRPCRPIPTIRCRRSAIVDQPF